MESSYLVIMEKKKQKKNNDKCTMVMYGYVFVSTKIGNNNIFIVVIVYFFLLLLFDLFPLEFFVIFSKGKMIDCYWVTNGTGKNVCLFVCVSNGIKKHYSFSFYIQNLLFDQKKSLGKKISGNIFLLFACVCVSRLITWIFTSKTYISIYRYINFDQEPDKKNIDYHMTRHD